MEQNGTTCVFLTLSSMISPSLWYCLGWICNIHEYSVYDIMIKPKLKAKQVKVYIPWYTRQLYSNVGPWSLNEISPMGLQNMQHQHLNQKVTLPETAQQLVHSMWNTIFSGATVDGSEIPNNHLGCMKPCKKWDKLPFPQLVNAGFLNHQQHGLLVSGRDFHVSWIPWPWLAPGQPHPRTSS